jgi:Skp family chaperone for outer membrane proteins
MSRFVQCVLVAVMGLGLCGVADAQDRRIAVVNVARVFNAYERTKVYQEVLRKELEPRDNDLKQKMQSLRKWNERLQLQIQDPRTNLEAFKEMQRYQLDEMTLKLEMKAFEEDLLKRQKDEMKKVLEDIKLAIKAVAQAEQFEMVMRAPEWDEDFDNRAGQEGENRPEAQTPMELVRRFRENPVLFYSAGIDITQKVIEKVNTAYKAQPK